MASTEAITSYHVMDIQVTNETTPGVETIVSAELYAIFNIVNVVVICQILSMFGMASNGVNILVIYNMGFRESINVSLFGLAISDFMSCLTLSWRSLCYIPHFNDLDLPFNAQEVSVPTGGYPHVMFIKISGCITAFIAFNRCLCVTFPHKVKYLITPKRVAIFIVCTCAFNLGLYVPVYYVFQFAKKFYPHLNKSLVGIVLVEDRMEIQEWLVPIRGIFLIWFLFFFIIVCTAVLVITLKRKVELGNRTSSSNQISSRDTKVAKLVVFISVVFIVCFIPSSINSVAMSVEPEFSISGRYRNLFYIAYSFSFNLEAINVSLNIFIYYCMSSRYKAVFDHMFSKRRSQD